MSARSQLIGSMIVSRLPATKSIVVLVSCIHCPRSHRYTTDSYAVVLDLAEINRYEYLLHISLVNNNSFLLECALHTGVSSFKERYIILSFLLSRSLSSHVFVFEKGSRQAAGRVEQLLELYQPNLVLDRGFLNRIGTYR